jgi:hypothetical protein
MTPQERDLITTLLQRLRDTARAGQAKDPEADALIRQVMREQPDAPYYLVQTVLIQDLSLHQAQNRIAELEQQLEESPQKSSGSFLGGLFGGREPSPPPVQRAGPWGRGPQVAPPPPQASGGYGQPGPQAGYPQQANPQQGNPQQGGMMGGGMMGGGGGFLRSAAATAAGVAGGALLFQGISSMFGSGYANSLGASMTPGLGESVSSNNSGGGDYGGGGDAGYSGGGDYGGSGGDYGGGDYGGGGDDYGGDGGGDFGGGGEPC